MKPHVNIVMVTYNQEKFIAQAIESVLMQKTDFPFKVIIGEDCSTDTTRAICVDYEKKFPDKIQVIKHSMNLGLLRNYKSVFDICTAKYLAILEGDDYWGDPLKLKKQVEILEQHDDIGFVHSNFFTLTDGKVKEYSPPKDARLSGEMYDCLIQGNYIGPLTVCFRKKIMDSNFDFSNAIENKYKTLDYALWLELARHTKFAYIPECLATYRKEIGSISIQKEFHEKELFTETVFEILKYNEKKYHVSDELLSKARNNFNYGLLISSIHYNRFDRVSYYLERVVPIGFIQYLRCFFARNTVLILIAKRIGIFN